ncbi:xanthine dehydrogenase family protein molybdopterin-binding subunit [Mesorhizobium sp. CO1-1-8]|uniref:xanthine dehydrogenase family protein molybdopterin-binding subunit n=1 Tax=Mesorhizobium sp. CO1-1-8 TaxID=2876631 RepID=UPI001CD13BF8|nr:xanthine dehydrogenase family protein molybdopterin-binding subunit [Mesorhizobium sp. CO1-1-8]MBZ9772581.1 xanthine dehydrogenase family protein molybdopterin-binding subunit [Mesorhizobium sp. CO1-1-8]
MKKSGIGASLLRKEDDRFMRGKGRYVGDLKMPGMLEVAFARSPLAHARILNIEVPEDLKGRVYVAKDLADTKPIHAGATLPGFKLSDQPVLAVDRVRHVGELVAMCLGATRAEAEDAAARIRVDYEELAPVSDMLRGRDADAPILHDTWSDNVFLESLVEGGETFEGFNAPIRITRELRTQRQCMSPMEGKGLLAHWDTRRDQLVVLTSTQMPHVVRTGLAECLNLEQRQVRVTAPDVGGGFGHKGVLSPEEVAVCWGARATGLPLRWLEDRREQLIANANCREHHYIITAYADRQGKLLGLEADATVDVGAYSAYPFTACIEPSQISSILPGPYDFPRYRCRTWAVATNKPAFLPYRGVARSGVCFALEWMLDAIARETGREPYEVRLENLIRPEQMPFDNITKKHFDSGDYPECMRRLVAALDIPKWRARQKNGEPDGRLIGIGLSIFNEQAAHGMSVYGSWGIPVLPGYELASVRVTPDGGLELRCGIQSHGQGLETSLSQVAHEILGVDVSRIALVHGDTDTSPYSVGTYGSRSMVMAGGAVTRACKELRTRLLKIGAHLLQAEVGDAIFEDGQVRAGGASVHIATIANTWYQRPHELPADVNTGGLEATAGYKTARDTGTFSYAAHGVALAVDPQTGEVEILDYVVVEDGGVLVNPMIVDGQVYGGVAQGIGTALYEEMRYDDAGQPLASTLADYLLPGPTEVPDVRILHMETPSPYTEFGAKGIGEGGAIGPPAAITNAINDALKNLHAEVTQLPVTPRRIVAAIAAGARIENSTTNAASRPS